MSTLRVTSGCLDQLELPLPGFRSGKVRLSWDLPAASDDAEPRRLFVTTDRLSAFDRVIGLVPGKGQMLNELAWWWFHTLEPVLAQHDTQHHALSLPDPNVLVARTVRPLPVEVIVRRAITGVTSTSVWRRYAGGQRQIDGYSFDEGLRKNALLQDLIITPTTKADAGGHDEPLSVAEVADNGLVEPAVWDQVCSVARAIFTTGEVVAEAAGLILADTKYEFGVGANGDLLLIDEVHTPDSSRYWERSTYEERMSRGEEPQSMDKEIIRRAFADRGYRGDGPIPELPDAVWDEVAAGYQRAYERLTGQALILAAVPAEHRISSNLTIAGLL
jgi:phosphoribosylaminoimidazole-succinocarboxamide synthase